MLQEIKTLFVVFQSFFNSFGPVCVLEPVFLLLSTYLRLGLEVVRSGIRGVQKRQRDALGTMVVLVFLNGRLLSRSAPSSRIARPDIKSAETVRNADRPRIGLEVVSLKNKYDHGARRVALPLLHTSDLQSGHFSAKKPKTGSKTQTG